MTLKTLTFFLAILALLATACEKAEEAKDDPKPSAEGTEDEGQKGHSGEGQPEDGEPGAAQGEPEAQTGETAETAGEDAHGGLPWRTDLEQALADAKAEGKPALIDFTADWCTACKKLVDETFSVDEVSAELQRFVLIKIDTTDETDEIVALMDAYQVAALPAVIFVDSKGNQLDDPRFNQFVPPDEALPKIQSVQ